MKCGNKSCSNEARLLGVFSFKRGGIRIPFCHQCANKGYAVIEMRDLDNHSHTMKPLFCDKTPLWSVEILAEASYG